MNTKCPECNGELEEGIIPNGPNQAKQKWGTKVKLLGLENEHDIKTYRCKSCGFLKSYAK